MKILLLLLISWCLDRTSTHRRASLRVTPGLSQYFEYQDVTLSCEPPDAADWTLWRYSDSGAELSQCGDGWGTPSSASTCQLHHVKQSDSGVYWCQSSLRDSSNAVSIAVTEGPLILDSPVLPVAVGLNVTLRCKSPEDHSRPAVFYRNDVPMSAEPSDHMTVHQVSKSDEAVYKCGVSEKERSLSSWLLVQDTAEPPSLAVSPDSAQLSEYKDLLVSCGVNGSGQGWTVRRFTRRNHLSSCDGGWGKSTPSGCLLSTVKRSDSAIYWCESPTRQRSNSVNISVLESGVVLQSPALPVREGDSVHLTCEFESSGLPADFYRDGAFIGSGPAGSITLHRVTAADAGHYRCDMGLHGQSQPSRLLVREADRDSPGSEPTQWLLRAARCLLLCSPYVASTVLMVALYQHKPAGGKQPAAVTSSSPGEEEQLDPEYDDVIDDVTTEHRF